MGVPEMLRWAETIETGARTVDLGPFVRAFLPWAVIAGVCQAMAGIFASQVVARINRGQRAMSAAEPDAPPRPDLGR